MTALDLPAGIGTGVGSMPGTDPRAAATVVNGELDFAHLVELPDRGIGADLIGRMAAILVDLPMDTATWGYRLAQRHSRLTRRAADLLAEDLDVVEELWETAGFVGTGRPFKVQVAGPFTTAASVELANGHRVLKDQGAVRDIVASTAEGLREHVGEVVRRLGARVVVQLDEPMIGQVIDGTVKPLTRFDPIRAVPVIDVARALTELVEHVEVPVVLHDCGGPRWDLLEHLRGVAYSVDVSRPTDADLDGIGMLIDRGDVLVAGCVPSIASDRPINAETVATGLAAITDRIGLNRKVLSENVVVTPTCGLAGASESWAKKALAVSAEAGQLLATDPTAL
ncbi:vitamin-B12 independent methionine synthase [Gordonia jinghuaiqii]|uniref:Vitamin-B12 independent methionine synthase n=1 Tax=Gordonia jinghuaiqii TaxID=2758710 RepID=A0A7D7R0S4_9ACTN|nr:vitamin-B12 independent methionine synthase [Gordonia jinghuaiqii]MCR5977021.1 vitamin-B12 independent methionine synthase [Gordonia jinghuaiqii]QMT00367.1 vitamin-B12 independent methionine synthase [Gordonia jinghuaiqii]